MNIEQLIELMGNKPYLLRMGRNLIAKRYKADPDDVVKAKLTVKKGKTPKILIFDIETSPLKAYVWGTWKTNVHKEQILNDWFCIAWSAKWLYSNEILGDVVTPEEAVNNDDRRIMASLWELIDKADIVVAHNGNKFDIPRINSRFVINGLTPTKPYFSVDTCRVAKRQFNFTSNSLNALASYFGIDNKLETDFSLWKRCLEGDRKALDYMLEYNKKDVAILEEVYLILRPWIKNHPNMGNLDGNSNACSNCGSLNTSLMENRYYYTSVGKYSLYRCRDCGAVSRGRVNLNIQKPELTNVGK